MIWGLWGWLWAQYAAPTLLGVGGAQAALSSEPLSANPAAAFPFQRWQLQLAASWYVPAPELSFRMGGASFSWDSLQAVQLLAQQWGFDKITQSEVGIGYGLRFLAGGKVGVATRGRLLVTNFSEYGRVSHFTPDIGLQVQLAQRWRLGGYGYNLLARGWGLLPGATRYGVGVSYLPSTQAQVLTELSQEGTGPLQVRTGFVYAPLAVFAVRAGVALPMLTVGAGMSLRYKKVRIDLGYQYQPATGSWASGGVCFP